ncbi:MAG TPA: FAD-dependent monooxygenase [Marmoricola sp.]
MIAAQQPVVVVGNGPVGQTTALLLARWSVPVVVVDARAGRELVGSKAICQQRDVLDIWDAVGAGRQIADEGVTWTRARTFHRDAELFCTEFQDSGASSFPPFVNISQCRTEQLLDQRVADEPLIEVRWGHRVTGLDQDPDGVRVSCQTPAGTVEVTGSHAVVCCGARGEALRALLGLRFDGESFGDRFLICDLRTDLPGWEQERRFYFDPEWNPGRQVLIHPCPGSTFRIDWQVPEGFDLAEEQRTGGLDRRIRQVIGDRDYEVVWQSVYRFQSRVVDRMRVGRVLLAGDSAHLFSPFGARGLNSGVMDAENAAWKLAFVVHGWAPGELLESYHDERHAAALENLDVTAATMRFLVPQDEAAWDVRRSTLEAARYDDAARARVDSGRLAEPFWYADSPLTTPDPERPFPGRPAKGAVPPPGPGILLPDFPLAGSADGRLRMLLRRGITVLTGPGVDPREVVVPASAGAPAQVHAFDDLVPGLSDALGARPGELWLVRPDAHVAAVVRDPAHLATPLSRLLGRREVLTG